MTYICLVQVKSFDISYDIEFVPTPPKSLKTKARLFSIVFEIQETNLCEFLLKQPQIIIIIIHTTNEKDDAVIKPNKSQCIHLGFSWLENIRNNKKRGKQIKGHKTKIGTRRNHKIPVLPSLCPFCHDKTKDYIKNTKNLLEPCDNFWTRL